MKKGPTISWEEAPDTIMAEDLAKILGCSIVIARNKFYEKGFPRIEGIGDLRKADKQAARFYIQGKDYIECHSKTVTNQIQREILKTLKEIKTMLEEGTINNNNANDKLNNKSFHLKCVICDEE